MLHDTTNRVHCRGKKEPSIGSNNAGLLKNATPAVANLLRCRQMCSGVPTQSWNISTMAPDASLETRYTR